MEAENQRTLSKKEKRKEYLRKYQVKYGALNRERLSEYQRCYRMENRGKYQESSRKYYRQNREKEGSRRRKYRKQNPERIRSLGQSRRARIRGLESTLTPAEWRKIIDDHFSRCHYCGIGGVPLTQDHKIPVSRGGGYTAENIVPACLACNSSKGAKDYNKFAKSTQSRLQMTMFGRDE